MTMGLKRSEQANMRRRTGLAKDEAPRRRAAFGAWARRAGLGTLLLTLAVGLLTPAARSDDPEAGSGNDSGGNTALGSVDGTRNVLKEWVETRRTISKERRDWALGKEVLDERIELVQREIRSLRDKIDKAKDEITEADKQRAALIEENDKLKEASAGLFPAVGALETRTKALLLRLPESVRDGQDIKQFSQQFPDDPNATKPSLGTRFQNVVAVLTCLNKRGREITVTSEKRKLADGSEAEVAVLYVGLSQAYYVSENGHIAGTGTLSGDQWVWTPLDSAGPAIAQAIAILKNEQVASFVRLPVKIQ